MRFWRLLRDYNRENNLEEAIKPNLIASSIALLLHASFFKQKICRSLYLTNLLAGIKMI